MKSHFPEYAIRTEDDYRRIWDAALVVCDTNVLLNLYRYRAETRDELLNVLRQLSTRLWIPHHVALEFYRNRLTVIAEQNDKFVQVKKIVEGVRSQLEAAFEALQLKTRHTVISTEPLTSEFTRLSTKFLQELSRLEEKQQSLTGADPILIQIETLFDQRVGAAPKAQADIDNLYKEADERVKWKIPPGYCDQSKGTNDDDFHTHGGIVYKRRFGDFLVWKQLLSHAKKNSISSVIFVSGDASEDWWKRIKSSGLKTIGPRPELVDEARREGGIDDFVMYNPESFLRFAKGTLNAPISEETLKDVRNVSSEYQTAEPGETERQYLSSLAQKAVFRWLKDRFGAVIENRGFPDYFVERDGRPCGVEVRFLIAGKYFRPAMIAVGDNIRRHAGEALFEEVVWVVVCGTEEALHRISSFLSEPSTAWGRPLLAITIILGTLGKGSDGEPIFERRNSFVVKETGYLERIGEFVAPAENG